MNKWQLITRCPAAVRWVWRAQGGRWALFVVLVAFVAQCFGVLVFTPRPPSIIWIIQAVTLPIQILAMALGYLVRDPAPGLPGVEKFLVTQAAHLYERVEIRNRTAASKAIAELLRNAANPLNEAEYIGRVLQEIRTHSVCAVCGQKSDEISAQFADANAESWRTEHYVERVFLPPENSQQVQALRVAITHHLEVEMRVLVFGPRPGRSIRERWSLPPGFGMTLIGDFDEEQAAQLKPPPLVKVLIHWGGVSSDERHYGVLIENDLLFAHFWSLYQEIKGNAQLANCKARTIEEFLTAFPHYGKAEIA